MLVFWILATVMTLVALGVVLVPLLRAKDDPRAPSARAAALEVLRGQRQEIEADIAAGTLPAEAREEALSELVERAGEDLPPEQAAARQAPRPWLAASAVAVAIPAIAFGLYAAIGMPSAIDLRASQAKAPAHEKELVAMVEKLAAKVRAQPDDPRGWDLLARSMSALGRFGEAVEAYEHLDKLAPRDPNVLADWADALGMAQGRSLRGRPMQLAEQALAIDPKHSKALALAATAAMEARDYPASIRYWHRLAESLPPGSPDAEQVRAVMDEVRQLSGGKVEVPKLAQAPAPAPAKAAPPAAAKAAPPAPANAPADGISGSVALAPSMAAKVTGGEHLFVFARAEGGPRVPLAVVKLRADALPYQFALDDSQAMAPGMNISSAQAVRIEARISRSGDVKAQPGDLVGTSDVVKPGARGVKVLVDKVVP